MEELLIENEDFRFWKEDGIICCLFKKPVIDLETAKRNVLARKEVTLYQNSVLFVDLRNLKSATREARDYYSSEEAMDRAEAAAAFTNSVIARIVAGFFQNFHKPRKPFKIFNSKEKAFEWLKTFEVKID